MIGLDTNVLVRFLVQDDRAQAALATARIGALTEADPGFVSREVQVELVWVLERAYGLPRAEVARALEGLLEAQELVVEASDRTAIAADRYHKGGPGFADQMVALAGQGAGCTTTLTFDRKAARIPGMRALEAETGH